MAYFSDTLKTNVRTLLHNVGSPRIDDEQLITFAHHALSLLQVHRPALIAVEIDGADLYNYRLDNQLGWLNGQSLIQWVGFSPDLAGDEAPLEISSSRYSAFGPTTSGQTWIIFKDSIPSTKTLLVMFSGSWSIAGIDDATVTTLTNTILISALEYLTAYNVCLTLSAAAAGFTSRGIPNDPIDYGDRRDQYNMAAEQFYKQFEIYLQLVPEMSVPAGGFFVTDLTDDDDVWPAYHTHRRSRG